VAVPLPPTQPTHGALQGFVLCGNLNVLVPWLSPCTSPWLLHSKEGGGPSLAPNGESPSLSLGDLIRRISWSKWRMSHPSASWGQQACPYHIPGASDLRFLLHLTCRSAKPFFCQRNHTHMCTHTSSKPRGGTPSPTQTRSLPAYNKPLAIEYKHKVAGQRAATPSSIKITIMYRSLACLHTALSPNPRPPILPEVFLQVPVVAASEKMGQRSAPGAPRLLKIKWERNSV